MADVKVIRGTVKHGKDEYLTGDIIRDVDEETFARLCLGEEIICEEVAPEPEEEELDPEPEEEEELEPDQKPKVKARGSRKASAEAHEADGEGPSTSMED